MAMADQQLCLEIDLIRQAQNGNSAAFGELYTRHLAAIQHYIQKQVGERCDAEDLTQTVFVKAWHALCDYQPSGAPFRSWLYRIAHNAIVDHYRTQRHALLWDDLTCLVDPRDTPEVYTLAQERQETVRNAVAGLRKNYQTVIEQRFLQELDYSETAAALGQQINHVRVVQHRALDVLRRVLSQENVLWLATAVTVMTLLLGGKIVMAAEQALPGDQLYPMRTWVEETSLFLADDAHDVQLHTRFATQRLMALSTLYEQGRRADMATAIATAAAHIRSAATQLATVQAAERTTVVPQFAAALQSQADTLQQLTRADPQTTTTLEPVLNALTAAQATLPDDAVTPPTPTPTATLQVTATRVLVPTAVPTCTVLRADEQKSVVQQAVMAAATPSVAGVAPTDLSSAQTTNPTAPPVRDHQGKPESSTSDQPQPSTIDLPTAESTSPGVKPTVNTPAQPRTAASNPPHEDPNTSPDATADPTMAATAGVQVETTTMTTMTQPDVGNGEAAPAANDQRTDHDQSPDNPEATQEMVSEAQHIAPSPHEPTTHDHDQGPQR